MVVLLGLLGFGFCWNDAGEGLVDWEWLAAQPAVKESRSVRHLRFAEPLVITMNGKTNQGVILKPGTGSGNS